MPTDADKEREAFLNEIEQRRGGKVTYRTFSTFYADSDGNMRDFGLFYMVNGIFWFQDFERDNSFLGFRFNRFKTEEFIPFESSFSPLEVVSYRTVLKKFTRKCAMGQKDFSKLHKAPPVISLLSETVTEIRLQSGKTMYFQFADKTVLKMIDQMEKQ